MRIKSVKCDQFAGLTDKGLELDKGLNLVIGDNESGKSTLIDLIFQLLFKDVKLDGRSDSAFLDKYFPKKVSGPQGDVIDGVIIFETPSGTYKLKKEWEKGEGTCRLTLPDGTSIKGNDAINKILAEELKHRAGVYNEIVFASQKRDQIAVESIMRALGKKADALSLTRDNLTSTLTQVALETGGVSLSKLEKAIKNNMDELIGRWDLAADAPEGGAKKASYKNAWSNGAGKIVKAYYDVDEVRSKQSDAENAERAVEAEKAGIRELTGKKKELEAERAAFQKYRGIIGQRTLLTEAVKELKGKISEQADALEKWPLLTENIEKAAELKKRQGHAQAHELYLKAEPLYRTYLGLKNEYEKLREVDAGDITELKSLINRKSREEGRLAGMNLVAKIREKGSAKVSITSAASGEELTPVEGEIDITEAVDISIPGIFEMQLMPKGVDVEEVKKKLTELETEIDALYRKYDVSSSEELQKKYDEYITAKQDLDRSQLNLEKVLGDKSWEEIKAGEESVPAGIESEAEIRKKITELCGTRSVDAYIGSLESTLSSYEKRYGSTEKLKAANEMDISDRNQKQEKLDSMEEIPEEYREIKDPETYDEELQNKIEKYEDNINAHRAKLSEAERSLGDKSAEEYSEELRDKEAVFESLKTEYGHWQHIYEVFCRLKEKSAGNPVEDIEEKFREYLRVITDGNLKLDSMDEKMSVKLASGQHALTYDILSDGTKDTVSLAFRLAMLEHLYPEGDGLAVFDDPFTDMDVRRVEQACKLIQRFAEHNQVVFVTCDDKYQKYMTGNVIRLTE